MLETVPPLNAPNAPGACKLQVIPVQYVVYVPPEVQSRIDTAITTSGGNWIDIRGTLWTQEFEEILDRRSGTLIWRATVGMMIPKDELPKLDQFADLSRQRFLALNHDRNSTMKLMGTKEEPAQISLQRIGHGRTMTDPNAYELLVSVSRRTKCPFYLADAPDTEAPIVCPDMPTQVAASSGSAVWAAMDTGQRADALASADGADLWAAMSLTQQADAVNSVSGSVLFALLTTLHQTQSINSITGSSIWAMANGTVQAQILVAAGVMALDEVNDEEPYGSYLITDE